MLFAVGGRTGGGSVFVKPCCAPGCLESCRSRSRCGARVAMCGDVGVGAVDGRDLAVSKIL